MSYNIEVTEEEIDNVVDKCTEQRAKGGSKWHGMTYEEGVLAALDWVTGNSEDNPI